MDFSFFLSYNRDSGLRLFNVQYKGRRILYEVCWQLQWEIAIIRDVSNHPWSAGPAGSAGSLRVSLARTV